MNHKTWKYIHGFDLGACPRKIHYNQPEKKSQNPNISPIWEQDPAERIELEICIGVDLGDVIMDVNFEFEKN